jgi:uncharacterized cupredoxin-like copper-binding protein
MFRSTTAIFLVVAIGALAACGDGGTDPAGGGGSADRTIEIAMADIAFDPTELEVTAGETVRLVFTNEGEVAHDAFLGDAAAQDVHAADMADEHGGGHDDDEGDAITVEPGESSEITHTFSADDEELLIGCHQPGHYEAGMVTKIRVS